MPLRIDDVDVVDGLGLADEAPDRGDRAVGGRIGRHGDELGGHDPAGGVRLEVREAADLVRLGRIHPDEDLARFGFGQPLGDVGGIVRIHAGEERCRFLLGERPEDRGGLVRIELLQDLGDLLVGQPLQEDGDLGRVEPGHERRPFGRADAFGEAGDAFALAFADQLLDLGQEGIGGHGRHGTALDGVARRIGRGGGRSRAGGRGRRVMRIVPPRRPGASIGAQRRRGSRGQWGGAAGHRNVGA